MSESPMFHGGKRGLDVGDFLVPSPPHVTDGCPICVARVEGRIFTVGEFRAWMRSIGGPKAQQAITNLDGVPDWEPLDPPSAENAVYMTTDRDYATWYAARSQGDLYRVEPLGVVRESPEDNFPSFTAPRARILEVVRRRVSLRPRERSRLDRRWKEADARRDALANS